MGMDPVGLRDQTRNGKICILIALCYMSRFLSPFARKTANVEDFTWCLKLAFPMYRNVPQTLRYLVWLRPAFSSHELEEILRLEGVSVEFSPSGSCNSTGMIEVSIKLLKGIVIGFPHHPRVGPKTSRGG